MLKIICAVCSAVVLIMSSNLLGRGRINGFNEEFFILASLLIGSFVLANVLLANYLLPISKFTAEEKRKFARISSDYYYKSFFGGAVALGYAVLLVAVTSQSSPDQRLPLNSYVLAATILVIVGTVSKIRGIIVFLLREYKNKDG